VAERFASARTSREHVIRLRRGSQSPEPQVRGQVTQDAGSSSAATAYAAAEEAAASWARTWFLDAGGLDIALMDGSACGPAMLVEAYERFLRVSVALISARTDGGRAPVLLRLKQLGLDRPMRTWGLRLAAAGRGHGQAFEEAPIAFVTELATPSSLEPMMSVAQALTPDQYSVRAADPRAYRLWARLACRRRVALTIGPREEIRILRRARQEARVVWQALAESSPRFELQGKDVTPAVMSALQPLVLRSMPWLSVERAALRRSLSKDPPRVAVVASDQHRIGRLVVEEAQAMGCPVVVLQHGLPQSELGYLPVSADKIALWSQASRRWFEERGTSPDRLVVLGNPRFDRLIALDRGAARRAIDGRLRLSGGGPNLLVPLSGASVDVNARIVEWATQALARMPHASLAIKLHPGLREWRFVRDIVAGLGASSDRVRVLHRDPTYPLLKWADVTFMHRSSVGLESLVAGAPVVAAGIEGSIATDLPGLDIPQVSSGDALAHLTEDLAGEKTRRRYFQSRAAALEDAAGPLDGQTCKRISRYLLELAQDPRGRNPEG
jgi:hypothetical protein